MLGALLIAPCTHATAFCRAAFQCSACYAYATAAAVEGISAIQKALPATRRVSRTQLINCDPSNSGCAGGWTTRSLTTAALRGILGEAYFDANYNTTVVVTGQLLTQRRRELLDFQQQPSADLPTCPPFDEDLPPLETVQTFGFETVPMFEATLRKVRLTRRRGLRRRDWGSTAKLVKCAALLWP